jgi:hypothetical protein
MRVPLCRAPLLLALLSALLLMVCPSLAAADPTAEELALLARVRVLLGASLDAITSVECEYDYRLNLGTRRCVYLRDAEAYYHASMVRNDKGKYGIPYEVAWDGQRAYQRARYNFLSHNSDREQAKRACPTPEAFVCNAGVMSAVGLRDDPGFRSTFAGAGEVAYQGHPCIELRFRADWWEGGTYSVRFARDLGYWPVYKKLTYADGSVSDETWDVEYERVESDGNVLFYPIKATARHSPSEPTIRRAEAEGKTAVSNDLTLTVDASTLRINKPIAPERFVLTAWPSEEVYDWDTGRTELPKDPDWSPVGKVGYPWDIASEIMEEIIAKDRQLREADRAQAANARAQGRTAPTASVAAEAPGPGQYINAPLLAGLAVLGAAGYWAYRQRRAAR